MEPRGKGFVHVLLQKRSKRWLRATNGAARTLPQRSTPALAAPHSTIDSTRLQLPRQRPARSVAAEQRQAQLRTPPLPRRTATMGFKKCWTKKEHHIRAPFCRAAHSNVLRGIGKTHKSRPYDTCCTWHWLPAFLTGDCLIPSVFPPHPAPSPPAIAGARGMDLHAPPVARMARGRAR